MRKTWEECKQGFIEEKLVFRQTFVSSLNLNGNASILCLFAGNRSRLTKWYAENFKSVTAVDIKFSERLPQNVLAIESTAEKFLEELPLEASFDIVDVDPDGSPGLLLERIFRVPGLRAVVLTDGGLTTFHFRRKMNVFTRYGILPDRVIKTTEWQHKYFECIVAYRVISLAQQNGYEIADIAFQRNPYDLALYAGFALQKGDSESR